MGRVKRYKKVKEAYQRKDDKNANMAPADSELPDTFSMKMFKHMMAKEKSSKKKKKKRGVKTDQSETSIADGIKKEEGSSESARQRIRETLKKKKGESSRAFSRRVRETNNKLIIMDTKSQQNKTLKRKRYLTEQKKKKKKRKNGKPKKPIQENERSMEFPTAEHVPFGATNDTVPDLSSVAPKQYNAKPKKRAKVVFSKKSKLSDAELAKERALVMKAYAEVLKKRKLAARA